MKHLHPCDICGQPVECDGPVTGGADPMDATCPVDHHSRYVLCTKCMDEAFDRR